MIISSIFIYTKNYYIEKIDKYSKNNKLDKINNNKYDYYIEKEDIIKELEYLDLIQNNQPDIIINNNNNENIEGDLSKKIRAKKNKIF